MTTPPILPIKMPIKINDVSMAFPADALDYMPPMDQIPEEFHHDSEWRDFQSTWFGRGLSKYFGFVPIEVDGERLDGSMIYRQLTAIQGSYAPKHEHKMAAIAYLASLWMDVCIYGPANCKPEQLKIIGDVDSFPALKEWIAECDRVEKEKEEKV